MCGLAGLLSGPSDRDRLPELAQQLIAPIVHRGPDDSGVWVEPTRALALGFRRLAIIDLSEAGHQPMASASGRFTISFNGEVFNFGALRKELEARGHRFRGHSDTEVMLAAFETWGIESAVTRFVGMFAFAVWDAQERTVTLARDRLGIKPLFVARAGDSIVWGSELKSIAAHPRFSRQVDHDAVGAYLRYLYVPAPRSIYRDAQKVPPGTLLTLRDPAAPLPEPVPYWDLKSVASTASANPLELGDAEATDELERLLLDVVGLRMIADVPLGALLSGGVDSSLIVSLMQRLSSRPVRTFTIGFDDPRHDEAAHAATVAAHLGTDHTSLTLTGNDALEVVPKLGTMYDEPLANPSHIPTFLVSALARRTVTVALSGDGGDELFTGYNRYLHGERQITRLAGIPAAARRAAAKVVRAVRPSRWDRAASAIGGIGRGATEMRLVGEKVHKMANLLAEPTPGRMYRALLSAWQDPRRLVPRASDAIDAVVRGIESVSEHALMERMMLVDQASYLADDLLAKVDRASMAVSLEARVPLLDHRVVEFAWRLPRHLRVREGRGKFLLRQLLHRYVPAEIIDRPKMGFTVPVDAWLRGPLREWAESLLDANSIRDEGVFDAAAVRAAWQDFLAGGRTSGLGMWTLLQYRAWSAEWGATA